MKYRVLILPSVEDAIDAHIDYIAHARHEPLNAQKVLDKLRQSITRLELFPNAAPYAPENDHRDYTTRMTIVAACRILFTVDEDAKVVRVVGFMHGGQMPRPNDLPST